MTTAAFKPLPEQEKVIAHCGGHFQVVACAGAGKPESIFRRVETLTKRPMFVGPICKQTNYGRITDLEDETGNGY